VNVTWEAIEIADGVVVVVAVDVMDVPAIWYCVTGIKPNLPMQACARAINEMSAVRVVIKPPLVTLIDDTTVFNDLDHMILPCGII
jgi:hypothetical protein